MKICIYDSTLRDGAQGENINYSVMDKLNITKALDEFGIDYIEAGNPFSNPKDVEYFEKVKTLNLKHSKIVAFGSTRRRDINACDDSSVKVMAGVSVDTVAIFGKSWDLHVTEILKTTLEENLNMISDTISYLTSCGKNVFFDAEHFFDGYKANSEYALETLKTAEKAGAKYIVLCDTNGGCFPDEISEITAAAKSAISIPVGIHCHNDTECSIANSISAVKSGATQVQGTFIGIGERCGNTNLSSLIPSLQMKLGYDCIPDEKLSELTKVARYVAEISNIALSDNMPYVGKSAFAHKGGMHVDGVKKVSYSFEHIPPKSVGNDRTFLISEVAGRTTILSKLTEIAPEITKDSAELSDLMEMLKMQEHKGFQYEAAEASFQLLVLKFLGKFNEFFNIDYFKIIGEQNNSFQKAASAMVKVKVGDKFEIAADEGDGPVNALDKALRNALSRFYPEVTDNFHLIDYKVRVMDTGAGTAAVVRVLIESTDGKDVWTTVGASTDIINASVKALTDSIEYKLLKGVK